MSEPVMTKTIVQKLDEHGKVLSEKITTVQEVDHEDEPMVFIGFGSK